MASDVTWTHLAPDDYSEAKQQGNYTHIHRAIRRAFGSVESVVDLFCHHNAPVTLDESFLDLDLIAVTFQLAAADNESLSVMLDAIESLLVRPKKYLAACNPAEIRFLLVILDLLLHLQHTITAHDRPTTTPPAIHTDKLASVMFRCLGLISFLPNTIHHFLVHWFMGLPEIFFRSIVELINRQISYCLTQSEPMEYGNDWRVSASARVMALLVSANELTHALHLQLFDFYNITLDFINVIKDFETWQSQYRQFTFCQYPFLISLGSKMTILHYDAQKQMHEKAVEAYAQSILTARRNNPLVVIHIRRDHLIQDSMSSLSSLPPMALKKQLRIVFDGEDGVDAGGLTKEWFMLLVRALFSPQYGMFTEDEESRLLWFHPGSIDNESEYYLVGVVMGLAIYHGTILDIAFPTAVYKKLAGVMCGMDDLMQFQPLLNYEGDDVETVFMRDFVATFDMFGEEQVVALVPDGEKIPITNTNRVDYVNRYVDWILNVSIQKQFEAFKKGFDTMCGGNAISLFRPLEIEALVRGTSELDLDALETVTTYDGFKPSEQTVQWFWEIFHAYSPDMQRKLFIFITGSDRIPATGISNMPFKLSCAGDDCQRLPMAHTCFNQLVLWRYAMKEKLHKLLTMAITESEGFGLR